MTWQLEILVGTGAMVDADQWGVTGGGMVANRGNAPGRVEIVSTHKILAHIATG